MERLETRISHPATLKKISSGNISPRIHDAINDILSNGRLTLNSREFIDGDPTGHRSRVSFLRSLDLEEFLHIYTLFIEYWQKRDIIDESFSYWMRSYQVVIDEYREKGQIIGIGSGKYKKHTGTKYVPERGRNETVEGETLLTSYSLSEGEILYRKIFQEEIPDMSHLDTLDSHIKKYICHRIFEEISDKGVYEEGIALRIWKIYSILLKDPKIEKGTISKEFYGRRDPIDTKYTLYQISQS